MLQPNEILCGGADGNYYKVVKSLGGDRYEVVFHQDRKTFLTELVNKSKAGNFPNYGPGVVAKASQWIKSVFASGKEK